MTLSRVVPASRATIAVFLPTRRLKRLDFPALVWPIIAIIGSFLGKYIAIVTLAIVYIVAVLPTGLLMKIVKRDRLRLKKPNVETYWLDNENKNTDYEYQF